MDEREVLQGNKDASEERVSELLSEAQAGSADAEAELFRIYSRLVKTVAFPYYIASESLDSEDIVQAGMIGLLKAVRTFDPGGGAKFETYASRCIKNAIIDEIRHSPEPTLPIDPEYEAKPDSQLTELAEAITTVLTPMERQVLKLRLSAMSYKEIAAELGIQKKRVDNLIVSAKQKLKKFLNG